MSDINLAPQQGQLTARIFENAAAGILRALFFDIEIPLQPFEYEDKIQETSVRLNFIHFGVANWRYLSGKTFSFPKNPEEGYIDGSVYLSGVHNPVDATRIQFSNLKGSCLPVSLDLEFDFVFEGLKDLGMIKMLWQTELSFEPMDLDRVMRAFNADDEAK